MAILIRENEKEMFNNSTLLCFIALSSSRIYFGRTSKELFPFRDLCGKNWWKKSVRKERLEWWRRAANVLCASICGWILFFRDRHISLSRDCLEKLVIWCLENISILCNNVRCQQDSCCFVSSTLTDIYATKQTRWWLNWQVQSLIKLTNASALNLVEFSTTLHSDKSSLMRAWSCWRVIKLVLL